MHQYKKEASNLIKLATPVLIASVAQTGMGAVDTIMAGNVSALDMASIAIAASIWLPTILFGVGLLMALIPIVAQLNGSGRQDKIPFEIQQGMALALILSIPIIALLYQTELILTLRNNVEPAMIVKASGYMSAVIIAVPAYLLFQSLRSFTDGLSLTKPAMVISFLGLLCNIPLNWIFVYGKFGAPAMGGVGCGVATTIVYWLMFFMLLFYLLNSPRIAPIGLFARYHKVQWKAQARLFKLGLPVALAIFFEVTLFAVVALSIAPLGPITVAAHQIAGNFSSLLFMLPMSIGAAVSIRVGYKLGDGDVKGATVTSRVGLMAGILTATMTATLTFIFREQIAMLYNNNGDAMVISLAMQLLILASIYQFSDAIQVVAAGALRGYKDMTSIFICTFIAYWLIGFPTGYLFGLTSIITEPMGAKGFWIGFIAGLSSASLMLGARLYWMHKQPDDVQLRFAAK